MQNAAVGAATDDGGVCVCAIVFGKVMLKLGVNLILFHAGTADLHGAHMGLGRDLGGAAHGADLFTALIQPHIVQQVIQGDEFTWGVHAGARLFAQLVDPLHDVLIEAGIAAHGIKHPFAILQHAWQNFIDVGNGEGVIGAVIGNGAFDTGAAAGPGFRFGIAFAAKQHVFTVRTLG